MAHDSSGVAAEELASAQDPENRAQARLAEEVQHGVAQPTAFDR